MITAEKQNEVKQTVEQVLARQPDWVTFYREILGLNGIVRKLFPTREMLAAFEQTDTYREIQHLLTKLREKEPASSESEEPTRVITVRLPKSMHEALRVEAHEYRTSMNKLCISKLLQFIDDEKVPTEI